MLAKATARGGSRGGAHPPDFYAKILFWRQTSPPYLRVRMARRKGGRFTVLYHPPLLTCKALSFLFEFIDKTDEKVFCLQMQIKLKSCVTLFS